MENTINLKSTNGTTVSNFSELEEIWKDIKNYEGLYQVSNMGKVKSLNYRNTKEERVLKQGMFNNGYCKVVLYKEGKQKNYLVHRLVCQTFIPNPDNYSQVNHKDENPSNNCVDNLEFCNAKYNANYGTRNERVGKANSIALKGKKLTQETKDKLSQVKSKPIVQLTKNSEFIKQWKSAKQASNELNILTTNISKCCNGKRKSAGKYRWMYTKDYYNTRTLNRMRDIFTKLSELRKQVG